MNGSPIAATPARLTWAQRTVAHVGNFAILVPVLVVAGCTTLHPTEPYGSLQAPPEHKARSAPPALLIEVPPLPPSGEALRLADCIALALAQNPELLASGWDAEAARNEIRVQGAQRWPNIHVTGSYFHHQDAQRLVQASSPGAATYLTKDLASADVVLRLPLYAGGRIVNEIRAAELLARASEHGLARTREELVFNVSSTYFGILAQEHVVESLAFSRDTLREHRDRVNALIAAQKAAKVDALRTEVRLADLEQQWLRERNVLEITRRLLANLLGLETLPPSGFDLAVPLVLGEDAPDTADALARAWTGRSDYAAAAAALESQARRVDIARGERDPAVSLEASYGGRWGLGGSGEPSAQASDALTVSRNPTGGAMGLQGASTFPLANGNSLTATLADSGANSLRFNRGGTEAADEFEDVARIGVTMDIPIFEGGAIRARIARERAKLDAARQRLRKLELQIRLEVETAVLNATSARERVGVTEKAIAEAEESLRIEREKYDYGKGAIVDVLDAQSALLTAQTSYYRALADYNIATAQVRLATGDAQP